MINLFKLFQAVLSVSFIVLFSCSGQEIIQINSFNSGKCFSEEAIPDSEGFSSIAVDSLTVVQENNLITAGMNVRTYCNSEFNIEIKISNYQIYLFLSDKSDETGNCVCTKKVHVSFNKPEKGFYNIVVTNSAGTQLLDQTSLNIE